MNDTTPPASELFVTQFLVVSDQDRSRDFYQSVFGAEVVRNRDPGHPGAGKGVPGLVGEGRHVPHRTEGSRIRNPRLHPRSGRSSHRGRPDHV